MTLLMMTVASEANESSCCNEAIESVEEDMNNTVAELKDRCMPSDAVESFEEGMKNLLAELKETYMPPATSCKELYDKNPSLESGVYTLLFRTEKIPVYCHMENFGCGNGGWTPVMKIDGRKKIFYFRSSYWSNQEAFNLTGGTTGFDKGQTKLPSYWSSNFSKICLGMKIDNHIGFVLINKQASSLYSLIEDGHYRATHLGRGNWMSLVRPTASLQPHCNQEGFNAVPSTWRRVRIGLVANNENHCNSCDSFIGFGYNLWNNTCGNYNYADYTDSSNSGDRNTKGIA